MVDFLGGFLTIVSEGQSISEPFLRQSLRFEADGGQSSWKLGAVTLS